MPRTPRWQTRGGRPASSAANFALRFDGGGAFARLLGAVYALQRLHGVYYGDAAVWVRREAFATLGGYREIPIMDDYDLARRPGAAVTSSRRWRSRGIPRTVLAWLAIRWLYAAGVAPERLARWYRVVR